jgi:threonine dehydratase
MATMNKGSKATEPVTPIESYPEAARIVGVKKLYFKREDLHPYGSHKGRSIPVMIETYAAKGDRRFAITGSGNAAFAAALFVHELNAGKNSADPLDLTIFVGNNIAPHKAERLKNLEDDRIRVLIKERPLQALTQAINEGVRSLRQSTDDEALAGYAPLAQEMIDEGGVGAVFIGTSSGTTAQALAQYFKKAGSPIQVHIVQTSSCHPIAESFEPYDGPDEDSIADAIVDKTAHRKDALLPLIDKTGGRGWIVTNDEISAAQELTLTYTDLDISTNSALSVAGAMKAAALGWEFPGAVVCMICGE